MLFGSDGERVPPGVGFREVFGGTCAPEPVDRPEPDAEPDGAFEDWPVLSRWKNSTKAPISAMTGTMSQMGLRDMDSTEGDCWAFKARGTARGSPRPVAPPRRSAEMARP